MAKKTTLSLVSLETTLDEYFGKKAPALPKNIKEIIVKFAPYLAILGVIISLPGILIALGLGGFATTMMVPYGGYRMMGYGQGWGVSLLLLVPVIILEIMAIPGLFKRKMMAWRYLFWAQLVTLVGSIVSFNIVGALIGAVIGFYLLFQVRSYYK